jgi:hypothetical protein
MPEEYMSGEKHRAMATNQGRKQIEIPKSLLVSIAIIILMILSFYGGVTYQKHHHPASTTTATSSNGQAGGFGGRGRFGNGQRPTIGQVMAISATSITVQDSRTGTSSTLSITSSTQITDNGQTVAASDIQTGDTALVTASTSDKTQAARILVNPSFGGGAAGSSSTAPSATTN